MSADRLREAARVLRDQTEGTTPGPWMAVAGAWGLPTDGPDHMRVLQAPHRDASTALARLEYDRQGGADAHYIATMHPGVGLALADWLDAQAKHIAMYYCATQCEPDGCDETKAALTLADLILGGAS